MSFNDFVRRFGACRDTCTATRYIKEVEELQTIVRKNAKKKKKFRVWLEKQQIADPMNCFEKLWLDAFLSPYNFPPDPIPKSQLTDSFRERLSLAAATKRKKGAECNGKNTPRS